MEFEKDGYTWNQNESLADLIKPERIRQIKLDIIRRQQENKEIIKEQPLLIFLVTILCVRIVLSKIKRWMN